MLRLSVSVLGWVRKRRECCVVSYIFHITNPHLKGGREVVRAARRELWLSDLAGILPLVLGELRRAPGNLLPPPATRREPWSYPWLHHSHAFRAAAPKQGLHSGSAAAQLCALSGPPGTARHPFAVFFSGMGLSRAMVWKRLSYQQKSSQQPSY